MATINIGKRPVERYISEAGREEDGRAVQVPAPAPHSHRLHARLIGSLQISVPRKVAQ
jgi:hypothetical protein